MLSNQFTMAGNLTADPELRFTASGIPVVTVNIASTSRKYDKEAGKWVDDSTVFMKGTVWRQQAENAAESLAKGDPVVAVGVLKARSWETPEGDKRTVTEMDIDTIAVALGRNPVKIRRQERTKIAKTDAVPADPWSTTSDPEEIPF